MAKKKQKEQRIRLAIVSIIVLICISLLFVPFLFIRSDESKFTTLSSTMKTLLTTLQSADNSSSWRYSETCSNEYSDDLPSGRIVCLAEAKLQRSVSSGIGAKQLHDLYYGVISDDPNFRPTEDLSILPDTFGKKFVVSVLEQPFSVVGLDNITCRYGFNLGQLDEDSDTSMIASPISTKTAIASISFSCSGIAQNNWY